MLYIHGKQPRSCWDSIFFLVMVPFHSVDSRRQPIGIHNRSVAEGNWTLPGYTHRVVPLEKLSALVPRLC